MELNMIYSVLGSCGGLLAVIADMLFDIKGKDNKELIKKQI